MTTLNKRATVYLDPQIHRLLKLKAVETSRSNGRNLLKAKQKPVTNIEVVGGMEPGNSLSAVFEWQDGSRPN